MYLFRNIECREIPVFLVDFITIKEKFQALFFKTSSWHHTRTNVAIANELMEIQFHQKYTTWTIGHHSTQQRIGMLPSFNSFLHLFTSCLTSDVEREGPYMINATWAVLGWSLQNILSKTESMKMHISVSCVQFNVCPSLKNSSALTQIIFQISWILLYIITFSLTRASVFKGGNTILYLWNWFFATDQGRHYTKEITVVPSKCYHIIP